MFVCTFLEAGKYRMGGTPAIVQSLQAEVLTLLYLCWTVLASHSCFSQSPHMFQYESVLRKQPRWFEGTLPLVQTV